MKILYAIQGTGNGHMARAREILPLLREKAQVDILVSGVQVEINLPFEVKYRLKGVSFIFGKSGGVNFWQTWKRNKVKSVYKEIKSIPVKDYDFVINDYEPITAWACILKNVRCYNLSHQGALLSKKVPKPNHKDWLGALLLKYYAPTKRGFSFHFEQYDDNIYTPVIRKEVRELRVRNNGHICVYLPAYSDDKIIKKLGKLKKYTFEVFSKHSKEPYTNKNVKISPINNENFIKSMASSDGVICGAGFETPAEALFLGKKLLVIPMKNQYEQHYNAASLFSLGVAVIKSLKKKHIQIIKYWLSHGKVINISFPNKTEFILDLIIEDYVKETNREWNNGLKVSLD